MKFNLSRRNKLLLVGALILCSSSALLGWYMIQKQKQKAEEARKKEPVAQENVPAFAQRPHVGPDALVVTQNLSELPKDLLKLPLVNEIFTEEFVFYYQDAPDVLSLFGSLKRIAFEHNVTLVDRLFTQILSGPAEIALWRSPSGRLEEGLMVLPHAEAVGLLKIAEAIAPSDSQLTLYTDPEASIWPEPVYRYEFRPNRALYLTSWGKRLLVFTHPKIPLPTSQRLDQWEEATEERFGKSGPKDSLVQIFETGMPKDKHGIYLSMDYLSFGYDHFLSSFSTVKFLYNEESKWKAASLSEPSENAAPFVTDALWTVLPRKASLCFAAVLDPLKSSELIERSMGPLVAKTKQTLDTLQMPIAVCWYDESKMYTPLLLAKAKGPLDAAALKTIFETVVGNFEAGILTAEEQSLLAAQKEALENGETVDNPVKARQFVPALPVKEEKRGEDYIWSREVSSRYGLTPSTESAAAEKMRSKRFLRCKWPMRKVT